jgi:hypothetical protein
MRLSINEQWARGVRLFEVLNEVNFEQVAMGPSAYAAWLRSVYDLLKAEWPEIKLVSTPMAPNTRPEFAASNTFLWMDALQARNIFRDSYLVGAHSYWSGEGNMFDVNIGLFFTQLLKYLPAGGQMSITEFSNNQPYDSDEVKADQYIRWSRALPSYVHSVYAFALSADDQIYDMNRETWARKLGTVLSVIPSLLGQAR